MVTENLVLENAQLGRGGFRNFAGEKTQFNPPGKRTFVVLLDEQNGHVLEEQGWHIRWRQPRDEQDDPVAMLTVEVKFGDYPPKIILISGTQRTPLDESNIAILDTAEIERCDLIVRPYNWSVNGNEGTKAYVKTMYVTLQEDDFGGRYAQ